MHFPLKQLAVATLFAASLSALSTPAFANISADQSAAIVKSFSQTSVTDFRGFLGNLPRASWANRLTSARLSAPFSTTKP